MSPCDEWVFRNRGDNNASGLEHLLDARLRRPRREVEAELETLIAQGTNLRRRGSDLAGAHDYVEPWKFQSWRQDLDRWLEQATHTLANVFTASAVARDFARAAALDERPFPTPFDALISFGNSLSSGLNKLISIYQRLDLFAEEREGEAKTAPASGTERARSPTAVARRRWRSWSVAKRAAAIVLVVLGAAASAVTVAAFYFEAPWRDREPSAKAPTTTASSPATAAPRPPAQKAPSRLRKSGPTLEIWNKVTNGVKLMRDDNAHPAYLSTVPRNFCKDAGCAIPGTDLSTADTVGPAICQRNGAHTTNGDESSTVDDKNPGLYSSDTWYGVRRPDDTIGYISDVWVRPSQRGGLGLPDCPSP